MPPEPLRAKSGRFSPRPLVPHDPGGKNRFSAILEKKHPRVYCVSFWEAQKLDIPTYSLAVKQPDGFDYPTLDFFMPLAKDSKGLNEKSLRFKKAYDYVLQRNAKEIGRWIETLDSDMAFACWCAQKPYKLSRCTRILVANLLKRLRPDVAVILSLSNPAWKA